MRFQEFAEGIIKIAIVSERAKRLMSEIAKITEESRPIPGGRRSLRQAMGGAMLGPGLLQAIQGQQEEGARSLFAEGLYGIGGKLR